MIRVFLKNTGACAALKCFGTNWINTTTKIGFITYSMDSEFVSFLTKQGITASEYSNGSLTDKVNLTHTFHNSKAQGKQQSIVWCMLDFYYFILFVL